MPYIINGESSSDVSIDLREDLGYDYPDGLDLRPNSDLHRELKTKILERINLSYNEMSKRYSSWREIDKNLVAYIPLDDAEELLQESEPNKPVSIIFPYSYSMLEALLTYLSMAFFQDPIFQFEGVEDDDTVGAMLLELVIKVHCIKSKIPLNIHTALRDNLCYGCGVGVPGWTVRKGRRPIISKTLSESPMGMQETEYINMVEDVIYEGNNLSNVDPYTWFPDPSVAASEIQKGEFVSWVERDNYMNMLSEENTSDSGLFNVRYLKGKKDGRSQYSVDNSERGIKTNRTSDVRNTSSTVLNPIDRIKMYIKIIPKDWKLGESEYPEIWYFELASDDIIIACERAEHNHGMFPVCVGATEYDGYSPTPLSRMEILYGLQHTLDFLFNSHITNVRKAINDMLIVDPYLVNIKDLEDPKPGKLIRLRRPAWGRGVDKVVQQLGIQDITRANIADSAYITQWMDRISGADQSMQGSLRMSGPERLTGAEFQGTRGSAVSRLQRLAMLFGMQFMQDLGTMFAVHTQQYMKRPAYTKIVGRYEEQLKTLFNKGTAKVNPRDIYVNYDTIVRDGSIPGGNFSQSWVELFKIIGSNESLMQEFDISRIFMYIASQSGAKNVEDFKRKATNTNVVTASDESVAAQAKAGNIVPIGGM